MITMLTMKAQALARVKALQTELENAKTVLTCAALSNDVFDLHTHIAEISENSYLQVQLVDIDEMKTTCATLTQKLEMTVNHLNQAQLQSKDLSQTLEDLQHAFAHSKAADAAIVAESGYGSSGLAADVQSLFQCCCCHSSKHDPVQLSCLHYYCRSCFESSSTTSQGLESAVTCPACYAVTNSNPALTNCFLSTYKCASALRAEIVWCNTCEKTAKEEMAEVWCAFCAEAFCAACYVLHNKFSPDHRIFELEHARTLPLKQLTQTVRCSLHSLAMETLCFSCRSPKCIKCLETCAAGSHDLQLLSEERSREHISSATKRVSDTMERLGGLLLGTVQKCRALAGRLPAYRTSGQRLLVDHRRRLHDSTVRAFDESAAAAVCHSQQSTRRKSNDIAVRCIPWSCAATIEALTLNGVPSLQLLRVRNVLKAMVACCSSGQFFSIQKLLQKSRESGSKCIYGSLPLTSDVVLSACLGETVLRRAALRTPLVFRQASVTFRTPVACYDLAVTRDGHVLLAAREHGLLAYSDCGQQLSSWRPERQSDGEDDLVSCVAALGDGRAVVGVYWAQLVVLLKLSQTADSWQEDRRVALLLEPPNRLAVHGDLLAATETRPDDQQLCVESNEVKLLRMSSGQVLYKQNRDYDVHRVALTALCLVTSSWGPVKHSSGAWPWVVDAFSHAGQFLWRHETSDEEYVWGLCVSADTWSRIYVSVLRRDGSSNRVMAIDGADGRYSRAVLSGRTHGLQIPEHLSLGRGQQRSLLAVLSIRTVSLYEATNSNTRRPCDLNRE